MSDQPTSPQTTPAVTPAVTPPAPAPPATEGVRITTTPAGTEHVIYETEEAFDAAFGPWREAPDGSSYWNDWPLDIDPTIPIERVWTVVDGDSGAQWALPGGHLVNRVAYIVTENPWPHESIDGMVWDIHPDDD